MVTICWPNTHVANSHPTHTRRVYTRPIELCKRCPALHTTMPCSPALPVLLVTPKPFCGCACLRVSRMEQVFKTSPEQPANSVVDSGIEVLTLILALVMSESAIDSLQNGISATISSTFSLFYLFVPTFITQHFYFSPRAGHSTCHLLVYQQLTLVQHLQDSLPSANPTLPR